MRRAIASAEPFGYGPISKLRAIAGVMHDTGWLVDFVGQGTAHQYAIDERAFRSARLVDSAEAFGRLDRDDYDLAISVMDPPLVLWAHMRGLPCVAIDSLYWLWDWSDLAPAQLFLSRLTAGRLGSVAAAMDELEALTMPQAEYVAHALSARSFVQRTNTTSSRVRSRLPETDVVEVGAIVDQSYKMNLARDHWLVCLSGLTNPLVTVDSARSWVESVCALIAQAFDEAGLFDARVTLTGNSHVLAGTHAGAIPWPVVKRTGPEVLELMNRAHACLTPPGLTTMLEAVAYGAPILTLPPQHYAHHRIFTEFVGEDSSAFPGSLGAATGFEGSSKSAAADTRRIIEGLAAVRAEHGTRWVEMVAHLASGLLAISRDSAGIAARQRDSTSRLTSDFSGVREVLEGVEDISG